MDELALSSNVKFRIAAAGNPMLSDLSLIKLMFDPEASVRGWVARNPNVTSGMLDFLSRRDSDPAIRAYAKYRLDKS